MNLPETIKAIQRATGAVPDGIFGPATAGKVLRELQHGSAPEDVQKLPNWIDDRSLKSLLTLDAKAQAIFGEFYRLANATAATYGCTYLIIGGNRTWEEQDALYAIGRNGDKRPQVTKAKGGQSNHNFGIAADFGVFMGKTYLDESNPALAAKVHRACSMHAAACGLEWGGSWKSIVDQPHYQIPTGKTMMQLRELMKGKGSVL